MVHLVVDRAAAAPAAAAAAVHACWACRYDLHVLMVQHGKVCAACGKRSSGQKRKAADVPCPLAPFKGRKGCSSSSVAAAGSSEGSKSGSSKVASKKQAAVKAAAAAGAAAAAAATAAATAAVAVKLEESAAGIRRRSCRSKQQDQHTQKLQEAEEKPCPLDLAAAASAAAAGVHIKAEPDDAAAAPVMLKQEMDV
jgi:hypothetical protein